MVLYALSHEKDLLYRPLRQGLACLKTHLPASMLSGKMRAHSLREIFRAIFYVLKWLSARPRHFATMGQRKGWGRAAFRSHRGK
jgi:hypothetical protein